MTQYEGSKEISLDDLLPDLRFNLAEAGFKSLNDLVIRGPAAISQATGMNISVCEEICRRSRAIIREQELTSSVKNRFLTAAEIHCHRSRDENSKGISTGSKNVDDLFGGNGIEFGVVTQVYGESGTGKTQLCHTLCGTLPSHYVAIFIDTEDTFQTERIKSIAKSRSLNYVQILENIKVRQPINSNEQEQAIIEAGSAISMNSSIKLLIVDSMTSLYRADYPGREYLSQRQQRMAEYAYKLRKTARQNNIAVIITNQVRTNPDRYDGQKIAPIGGNSLAHTSKHRVQLRRIPWGTFVAKLDHSYSYPQNEAYFTIDERGITDVEDYSEYKDENEILS